MHCDIRNLGGDWLGCEKMAMTNPEFIAQRRERDRLIDLRAKEKGRGDIAWPTCFSCHYDVVAHYGEDYPTAHISGCPNCHRSFCD
jgi:hypothetical protein